jgi:hypothetical protein
VAGVADEAATAQLSRIESARMDLFMRETGDRERMAPESFYRQKSSEK